MTGHNCFRNVLSDIILSSAYSLREAIIQISFTCFSTNAYELYLLKKSIHLCHLLKKIQSLINNGYWKIF